MKILLAISGLHPRDGGPPRVVLGSAIALAEAGHAVTVLSALADGDEAQVRAYIRPAEEAGVAFAFVDDLQVTDIWFPPRAGRLGEAIAATDVLHCHGIWSPLLLTAARVADARGKPYFVSVHGLLSPWAMRSSRLKKRLASMLFGIGRYCERARGVIFGTRGEYEVSTLPSTRLEPLFVPNGVAPETGLQPIADDARARLFAAAPAAQNWRRIVLFYSRIHPKKGLDMLVEGFAGLSGRYPDTGLLIAGLPDDPDYQRAIERQIAEAEDARIVLTTALVGDASQFLYSLADLFVLPSHEEGFSMALLEALAHGCPSLSTTLCHFLEIAEADAGVVVEPTAAAIAQGLAAILDRDDGQSAAMRANARALFEARFTWPAVARQLAACYGERTAA